MYVYYLYFNNVCYLNIYTKNEKEKKEKRKKRKPKTKEKRKSFSPPACDISYDVSAGGHVAVARFRGLGVHDAVEEEGFAMLATEVLRSNSVSVWATVEVEDSSV